MRLLVVGAGATGGYFGGRLAAAGRDVTFLVRPARAAHLRANGLHVVSGSGDVVSLAPKIITADALAETYDVILVTVKAYSLDDALRDMAPAVGPNTMILPTLNGMPHVEVLIERFGAAALVGCVCRINSTIDDAGRIVQFAGVHELSYGEMNGAPSPRTTQLDALMQNAGFDAKLSSNIAQDMWDKWTLLATLGAACCLLRGTVGEIASAPGGEAIALELLDEITATISAVGMKPRDTLLAAARRLLSQKHSQQTSSMYRDLLSGGAVEAEQIIGDLAARAQQAGVPAPLLTATYANLAIYQNRLAQ